jgi:serine/threonine protein kinase/TolA-binding protein
MDGEQWNRAKEIFAAALGCDLQERQALVARACGEDEPLRREVESLLFAYASSDGLSTPWLDPRALGAAVVDRTIGPYRLIRTLGEGGMGQVWLAEQDAPVRRQVALKLIRVGAYDPAVLRRFQAERQSLATMDHPAIAKVFDAGATPDGQPYFVMEYVQGAPITDYCNQKELTIRARLALFLMACDGVQHAHQKAIIHRDLKPANLLVVDVDGRPAPRIIDFGLARAATPDTDQASVLTRVGSFVGTPGYMSPEQSDPSSHDVDTRTDVYSLGAILYELLTGTLPLDARQQRPLHEILRQLREADPPRPSARIAATAATIADERGTQPRPLVRQLRGDLDSISLKALERDRARRYGSPAELADDIRRYLLNQPILARPASRGDRLRKYVRRHRLGVTAAAAITGLLVALAIGQAVQLRRITRERDRADRITDFMTSMFRVADPSEARGNSVTAREILDKAARDVETGLSKDPALQAQMMDVMGSVYSSLGLYASAQPLLERAVQLWTDTVGADHPNQLTSKHNLADTLGRRGRYADAEKLERQTFEASRRVLGPAHPNTLRSMASLAITLENEGRWPEAEQLDREAVELARRALGEDHPDTLRPENSLGDVLQGQERFADAEKYHADVLARRRRVLGPEHPLTAITMQGLAGDFRGQGRLADAEALDRETVDLRRRLFGADHQQTLSATRDLARDIARQGRYPEAEQLNRQSFEIARRALGPEHPDTVSLMVNLALTLQQQQRYSESETLNRTAVEIDRRVLGPEHPYTLAPMSNLARDLVMQGKLPEAEQLARQTVEIYRRRAGPEHASTIDNMSILLEALYRQHRYAEAEELARQILDITRRVSGPENPRTADAGYQLGTVLAAQGKDDEATSVLADAVQHGLAREKLVALQTDADLKSLRSTAGFKAVVTDAKRRAATATGPH